jgi:short subunit dehydrogenase-like uncharacterized protein
MDLQNVNLFDEQVIIGAAIFLMHRRGDIMNWMLYGATGYTGQITAEEAVKQGHKPILAGRSETRLKPLAERLGLEYSAFSLDSVGSVIAALKRANVELVLHNAGPFIETGDVMIQACLETRAHYLDITGEIGVLQNAYAHHQQALDKGILIMPGVGFDVIPSDCLLKYVADQVPDATHLELVLCPTEGAQMTSGTIKSGLEQIRILGNVVRRDGKLVRVPFGKDTRSFRVMNGEMVGIQSMWGDVETGYRTTGIPNITVYWIYPDGIIRQLKFLYLIRPLLNVGFVRNFLRRQIEQQNPGPTPEQRQTDRMYLYAKAHNAAGEMAEAWLETCEGYRFTSIASLKVVEQVLDGNYAGALTPASAFGADFVLDIEGTERADSLDNKRIT